MAISAAEEFFLLLQSNFPIHPSYLPVYNISPFLLCEIDAVESVHGYLSPQSLLLYGNTGSVP